MTDGAHTPLTRARPDQPANLTDQTAGPDPASAKACQPPFTHRHAKALEQAGAHHGELIRLDKLISAAVFPVGIFCTSGAAQTAKECSDEYRAAALKELEDISNRLRACLSGPVWLIPI
jgi:hypothetical protein